MEIYRAGAALAAAGANRRQRFHVLSRRRQRKRHGVNGRQRRQLLAGHEYDGFGRLVGKWGTNADENTMRFSSMPFNRNSGLIGYWGRFYEPNFGRWLNRDPMGEAGGINLYGFVTAL